MRSAEMITNPKACNHQIKTVRKALGLKEVEWGKPPKWLMRRFIKYRKEHDLDVIPRELVFFYTASIICGDIGWVDHWGSLKGNTYDCCSEHKSVFVSEPYDFDAETAKDVEAFCSALDLTWHVTSDSWWYPGQTVRIVIHPA